MVYLIIFIISRFAAHFSAWSCMTALHSAWLTVICCMFAGMAIPWLIIRLAKSLRADKIITKLGLPV